MVIFNSYVTNYQRVVEFLHFCSPKIGWPDCHGSPRRDPALDGSNVSSPGIVIWIPNGHWSWLRNHQSCLSFQGVSIYIYIWIYGYISIYPYIYIYAYTLKRETGLVVSQSAPMSIGDPYDNSRTWHVGPVQGGIPSGRAVAVGSPNFWRAEMEEFNYPLVICYIAIENHHL